MIKAMALAAASLGMLASVAAQAGDDSKADEKISFDKAPAAVQATLAKEAPGVKIAQVEVEAENGTTTYEAKATVGGKECEIKVAADGKLISKEVETDDEKAGEEVETDDEKAGEHQD
jgi:uncharacterized membrane protein YkoI